LIKIEGIFSLYFSNSVGFFEMSISEIVIGRRIFIFSITVFALSQREQSGLE
jgi:hypothetical protein